MPVTGPAGTVMVFDGRLWHQTGANVTAGERRHGILAYYCRPFVRTQENWFLSIDPAVLERRPELKALLGYEHVPVARHGRRHAEGGLLASEPGVYRRMRR